MFYVVVILAFLLCLALVLLVDVVLHLRVRNRALHRFIRTIEDTGGVYYDSDGYASPVADDTWASLGDAYLVACDATGQTPKTCKRPPWC